MESQAPQTFEDIKARLDEIVAAVSDEELQLVWRIDGVKYAGHTAPPPIRPRTKYPNPTRLEPRRIRLP